MCHWHATCPLVLVIAYSQLHLAVYSCHYSKYNLKILLSEDPTSTLHLQDLLPTEFHCSEEALDVT